MELSADIPSGSVCPGPCLRRKSLTKIPLLFMLSEKITMDKENDNEF
jgi:hypothetical protein